MEEKRKIKELKTAIGRAGKTEAIVHDASINGKKGDMALWMLTKFGMLFFIIALMTIIFYYQVGLKSNVCSDQAKAIADEIAARITQVLDSPAEDEMRIYSLPVGLELGKNGATRYKVGITKMETLSGGVKSGNGKIILNVSASSNSNCEKGTNVPYISRNVSLEQTPLTLTITGYDVKYMTLDPAAVGGASRSQHLIIIKCGSKSSYPPAQYLFIQDCRQEDAANCYHFANSTGAGSGTDRVEYCCGWDTSGNPYTATLCSVT